MLLRRAEVAAPEPSPAATEEKPAVEGEAGADAEMVDGEAETKPAKAEPTFADVVDEQIVDGLPPPSTETDVTQHIELLLALCSKTPDLLDEWVPRHH